MKINSACLTGMVSAGLCFLLSAGCCSVQAPVPQPGPRQTVFKSPEDAMQALRASVKQHDREALLRIFGEDGRDIFMSGDAGEDAETRNIAARKADEKISLTTLGNEIFILIGTNEWLFPVPIVSNSAGWFFHTREGKEELLTRRIGRNELNAILICRAYVKAQQEYAALNLAKGHGHAYARKIGSDPGQTNGLYWATPADGSPSPLGPLMAAAAAEEQHPAVPFHGYLYKVLLAQGKNAPGGKKSFLKANQMTEGFALLAYPSDFEGTGIMSFMVSDLGIVYEKSLGPDTAELARKMSAFDPDRTWQPVLNK